MERRTFEVTVYDIRGDFMTHTVKASSKGYISDCIRDSQYLDTTDGGLVMINFRNCVTVEVEEVNENDEG